jgi:iron complex outermembrane receptor protein
VNRPLRFCLIVLSAMSHPLSAQYPANIEGVISDRLARVPLEGVSILVTRTAHATRSDAAGRFLLRAVGAGSWVLRVQRIGYEPVSVSVELKEGESRRVDIALEPSPVLLPQMTAAAGEPAATGTRLNHSDLQQYGAGTVGDVLSRVQGLVVRTSGPGGTQQVSIRGAPERATLVLLDGIPLNDPVTGEADLSTVDLSSIESITILPGGASSRYGGRAAAGVVLIETLHAGTQERHVALEAGSLGVRNAAIGWSGVTPLPWTLGASWDQLAGAYEFKLPAEAGGGEGVRENGDAKSGDVHASTTLRVAAGRLDIRAAHHVLKRGLPGRGYAPSPHARQQYERSHASAIWRLNRRAIDASLVLALARQRIRQQDDRPPFGDPYDDTTRVSALEIRTEISRRTGNAATFGAGAEFRSHDIRSTSLSTTAADDFLNAGAFAHGELSIAKRFRAALQLRADRDPALKHWTGSHSVTGTWSNGVLAAHVAHRSSFSPPTLGDRYFRAGVGIAPNPDLRAERIPAEIEAGLRIQLRGVAGMASLRTTAFRGNIDGMILWAPDYRFIWSPYNADVKRWGAETGIQLESREGRFRLDGAWTMTRVTYDRGPQDDDVQIAYHPRHTALLSTRVLAGSTQVSGDLRYTGDRTTAPTRVNTLSGFWTLDAAVSHSRRIGRWRMVFDVRVQRVLDEKDTLIFGFPEPGRTVRAAIRLIHGSSASQPWAH